jgi:hypothetical protein
MTTITAAKAAEIRFFLLTACTVRLLDRSVVVLCGKTRRYGTPFWSRLYVQAIE